MSNKVIDYVMNSPQNTNPNVLKGLLESSEQEDGTSDFSIVEVSITNNTNDEILLPGANIAQYGTDNAYLENEVALLDGMTKTFNIILYKGRNNMIFISDTPPLATCTGDIAYDGYGNFTIRGNGTITFGTAS